MWRSDAMGDSNGHARMTIFAAQSVASTFDYQPGDIGAAPFPPCFPFLTLTQDTFRPAWVRDVLFSPVSTSTHVRVQAIMWKTSGIQL